ncbi:cyclase [Mycobacterium sp. 1245111.1]|uniref:ATP-binding protein n=1 Tax=Mycobacterium sp. 1245111.1 TaxID=1834073 RepID=UPI0007FBE23C|nr:adenylate/guanylate cyclase domain-containing protein [Mycobacterium sp. 1245111.1]OBK35763.1 cyclase [Mycobacterium sp. 1245111.1]
MSAGPPPAGVVTFLFTDVEGSTRRWEADADAMRAALTAHDDTLRTAIDAHGGVLFKHTGDGVCAAFASPRAAVDAAVAAQRKLELPVRMGLATGEAELRDGDYFGAVLNRAARVMAAGHGGQILVDAATVELLSGVKLADLGVRRLRDISRPVNIFQVVADGLRTDFPALLTLDSTPGNLRSATTSFLGREAEIADLLATLKAHRLVTLTGPGGVGKTRLAVEVAARLAAEFVDGVWVVELAPVGDPAAVAEAVAATLGLTQQPGMNLADSVAAALEGRSRLLVFDNCEHLLDAAAELVDAILQHSATVKILATSREGLRLADEQLWPVPSLDTRDGADSTAAALFVERAKAVSPTLALSDTDQANAVAEVCRRLDGIPLAIELAASRMQSMTAAELHERLDDRFRLLTGSRRGLERHQTLRQAVQWSYDLLDDNEKSLLARCSVFAGGFDLAAARAIADSGDELAVLDLLDALVRKSLLVAGQSSGRTRYSMLETIRQFAEEQLVSSGEADRTRDGHAHYFAAREDEMLALWDSPRQRESYEWLARELPNLRAAFRWSVDRGDLDNAATIAFYASFLGVCSYTFEPVTWAEELIGPAQAADHRRLVQLCAMAAQCYAAGRVDEAISFIKVGQAALQRGGYADLPFGFESTLGTAYHLKGEPEKTVAMIRQTIARTSGADIVPCTQLAMSLANAGAFDDAMEAAEGLLAAADATDNPFLKAFALNGHGWTHRGADPAAAYDVSRRAMQIAHDSGNRFIESTIFVGLSRIAANQGDPIEALDYMVSAARGYQESGSFLLITGPLAMIAILFDRLGRYEAAATIMGYGDVPGSRLVFPEVDSVIAHLREVFGDPGYESLARKGKSMTIAAIVTYAFDEIEQARTELKGG